MINANEARELATTYGASTNILADIEVDIESACTDGEFFCRIPYPEDFRYSAVREKVLSVLQQEGYEYRSEKDSENKWWIIIEWENESTFQPYCWD